MTQAEIKQLIQKQRTFFHSDATLDVEYRIHALQKLKACILKYENEINIAIRADLGKCAFESYMCETGLVLSELTYMLKHTRKFSKERTVRTPLAQFHSRSYQKPSPYGVTLIMSPWNYPFMLTIEPLVDALAAGNTAILKPSAYSAHTTALISRMIQECFDEKYVAVVTGGREENNFLLNEHFDYIFFTGSQEVGKEVMRHASNHLTPITLELGGKSPCIVHKSADIKLAAKRIVFGKFLAALCVLLITELLTFIYYFILMYFGSPDFVSAIVTLGGFLLLGAAYISFGMFASSITENQVIAAILTIGFFILTWFLPDINEIFSSLSLINMFDKFPSGQIDLSEIVTFVSFTLLFVALTIIVLQRRKSVK